MRLTPRIICWFTLCLAHTYIQADWQNAVVLPLPEEKEKELQEDAPLQDIVIDPNNGVWVIGQKHLWYWLAAQKKLLKITLAVLDENEFLGSLLLNDDELLIVSNKRLFRVTFTPIQVSFFKLKDASNLLGLSKVEGRICVFSDNSIYELKNGNLSLIYALSVKLSAPLIFFLHPKPAVAWLSVNKFFYFDIASSTKSEIFTGQNKLLGLSRSLQGDVFIHTAYSAIRFANDGQLLASLPVIGQRELLFMSQQSNEHLYYFNDKKLELKNIDKKASSYVDLSQLPVKNITKIAHKNSLIALISDGRFFVLQLVQPDGELDKGEVP